MYNRRRTGSRRPGLVLGLLVLAASGCSRKAEEQRVPDPDLVNPQPAYAAMAPGVEQADVVREQPPLSYHVVRANLDQPGLELAVLHAGGFDSGRATVGQMAAKRETPERRVVAAINGDYFGNGMDGPWGVQAVDGRLIYSPQSRSAFLIGFDGRPQIGRPQAKLAIQVGSDPAWREVADLNRPGHGAEAGLHLYFNTREVAEAPAPQGAVEIAAETPVIGGVVTGRVVKIHPPGPAVPLPVAGLVLACGGKNGASALPPGLAAGADVRIRAELAPAAREAVGGGPRIVRGGRASLELLEDGICAAERVYLKRAHPRAAVGLAKGGRQLLLVVVRGRRAESDGLGLADLADLMVGLGAEDAMMFDGGDTAAIFQNGIYAVQGRAGPREISNGLALLGPRSPEAAP